MPIFVYFLFPLKNLAVYLIPIFELIILVLRSVAIRNREQMFFPYIVTTGLDLVLDISSKGYLLGNVTQSC